MAYYISLCWIFVCVCIILTSQGTLRDLFTIEPEATNTQPSVSKPVPVEETEMEEESQDEPQTASTADSAEASTEKPAGGKMSQTLLEQVWNMFVYRPQSIAMIFGNIIPTPILLLTCSIWCQHIMSSQIQWCATLNDPAIYIAEVLSFSFRWDHQSGPQKEQNKQLKGLVVTINFCLLTEALSAQFEWTCGICSPLKMFCCSM